MQKHLRQIPSVFRCDVETTQDRMIDQKTVETPAQRAFRLRREEAEDAHKRRLSLIVHVFVLTMVANAVAMSAYLAIIKDPETGLPDKAIGVLTAIVAGTVGYVTGKGSK